MQCYEFEVMCHTLFASVQMTDPSAKFDISQLADVLADHQITSFAELQKMDADELAEMVSAESGAATALPQAA